MCQYPCASQRGLISLRKHAHKASQKRVTKTNLEHRGEQRALLPGPFPARGRRPAATAQSRQICRGLFFYRVAADSPGRISTQRWNNGKSISSSQSSMQSAPRCTKESPGVTCQYMLILSHCCELSTTNILYNLCLIPMLLHILFALKIVSTNQ